jgi:hypothetical protein
MPLSPLLSNNIEIIEREREIGEERTCEGGISSSRLLFCILSYLINYVNRRRGKEGIER